MMWNLVSKLATAARGGTREVLEVAVDANALRILGQEIYECENTLRQSKLHLSEVMAEKLRVQRQVELINTKVSSKEQVIREQLTAQNDSKALVLAQELVPLDTQLRTQQQHLAKLQTYEQQLLQGLKTAAQQLEHYRAELRMAHATQHAQKMQGQLLHTNQRQTDQFGAMQDTLERIQARQIGNADRLQAMQEIQAHLNDEPSLLEQRNTQAQAILQRLAG